MKRQRKKVLKILLATAAVLVLSVVFLIYNANRILKYELERRLGKDFSIERISLGLDGVDAFGIKLAKANEVFLQADKLTIKADFFSFLKKQYSISSLVLERPVLRLKTDREGKLENPFDTTDKKAQKDMETVKLPAIEIKQILIKEGKLLYYDGKVSSSPHLTRIESISLRMTDMSIPFDSRWSSYMISAHIPGKWSTAFLECSGKTNFKTLDTDAKAALSRLDITGFKPYFQKKGDADVSRGILNIDMNLKISSKFINAPGKAVIKELEFSSGKGLGDRFIGVPRTLVINLLKTKNNEIVLDFIVEGKIDDPRFNISENLVKRLTVDLAGKLGLSVVEAGKSVVVLGVEGVKDVGKGIKGIGEGLQKIFRK